MRRCTKVIETTEKRQDAQDGTKVDIVIGFLGAGKTTLINRMLADGLESERPIVIENEFGDVSIDGDLLKDSSVSVRTLASGCICCTLKGDFLTCLQEVVEDMHPARIVIEPTGLANLPDMLGVVEGASRRLPCRLNSVTSVVDASCVAEMLEFSGDFYASQIRDARFIALTHTQGLGEAELDGAMAAIRELSPCPVMDVDAAGGVSGLEVLAASEAALEEGVMPVAATPPPEEEHHHHEGHLHAPGGFMSLSFLPEHAFGEAEIEHMLEALRRAPTGRVMRAKGFLCREDPTALEHVELYAGGARHTPSAYTGEPKLVVIGKGLDKDEIERIVGCEART